MSTCKYELKFNDEVYTFSSEEALDEFLLKNYDNVSLKIKGLQISASKVLSSNVENTRVKLAEMEAKARKTGHIHNDYYAPFDEVVEVLDNDSSYQAVTKYINEKKALVGTEEAKILMSYDEDNHTRFIITQYVKDRLGISGPMPANDERFLKKMLEIYADPLQKQQLEDYLVKTFARFQRQNAFGRIVHYGMELGMKKLIELGPDKFLNKEFFNVDTFTAWNESNIRGVEFEAQEKVRFSNSMYNAIVGIGKEGRNGLFQLLNLGELSQIYSEFPISYTSPDGQLKLIGVIDLLVIDSQGKAHIYDFKTSTNNIDHWSSSKQFRMRLQLGYYAQILRNQGIEVLDIAVLPVHLESENDFQTIQSIKVSKQSILVDLLGSGDRRYKRIINLILEDIPVKISKEQLSELNSLPEIDRVLKKTLNVDYRDKISKRDLEDQFEYLWLKQEKSANKKFHDKNTDESVLLPIDKEALKQIYIKSETEYRNKTMGGVLVDSYQALYSIYKRERANKPLAQKSEVPFVLSLGEDKNQEATKQKNINFNKIFGKYKGEEWHLLENETAKQLGFMLFLNNVSKNIDIVSISNENLDDLHKLPHGKSLLGNVYSDANINVNNDRRIVTSTKGHVELMKVMAFINFNTSFFTSNDYNIGDIKVVNNYSGGTLMTFEELKYNFAKLLTANGLDTDYKLNTKGLNLADPIMSLLSTILSLDLDSNYMRLGFSNYGALETFSKKLKDLFDMSETMEFRKEKIKNQILDILRQELKIRLKDRTEDSFKNPTEADYFTRLITGLIVYYSNSYIPQYEQGIFDHRLKLNTIGNLPSAVINGTRKILDTYIENIKTRFLDYKERINPITGELFDEQGYSKLRRYTIGDHVNAYSALFQKDKDGKTDPRFLFKNPFDKNNGLTETQRNYLKTILTIANDLKGSATTIEEQNRVGNYKFLQVPLVKSQYISFLKKGDFATQWSQWVKKIHNPEMMLFGKQTEEIGQEHKIFLDLKNSFANQEGELRINMLLENEISTFETDVEAIMDLFVLTHLRSQEFNKALPLILATKLTSIMDNIGVLNDIEPLIDYINDHLKIVVKGENLIKPGLEKAAAATSVGRHIASTANLMLNPISIARETTQAFYGALSRAAVKMYGKNSHSLADLTKLIAIITGESRKDVYQDMNIVESLNIAFGLSNMNLGSIIDRSSLTKTGLFHFVSNYLQGFNRAPEYMVRLGIFIAELIKDGAWDAYSFDEKEGLKYDWKKDARFSTYAAYKGKELNIPPALKERYFAQKGLYQTLLNEFNADKDVVLTELPHAYTTRQTESIKAYADSILGYYDPKSKIHAQAGFIGMNFLHFKTWMVALKDKWLLTGHKSEVIGDYILMKDELGNQVYITPTGELTLEAEGNSPAQVWEGKWCEGMLMSIGRLFKTMYGGGFSEMKELFRNDAVIQANLKLMISDILTMLIAYMLIRMLFKSLWKDDVSFGDAILSAIVTSPADLNPIRPATSLLKPNGGWIFPQFSYFYNVGSGLGKVLFGDKETMDWAMESFGMTRPLKFFLQEEKQLYVPSFSGPGGGQFGGGGGGVEF